MAFNDGNDSLEATKAFAEAHAGATGEWYSMGAPSDKREVRVLGYTGKIWGEYYVVCEHLKRDPFDAGDHASPDWVFLQQPSGAAGMVLGCFYASRIAINAAAKPKADASRFPHKCPGCGKPAYIGFNSTECSVACGQR